MVNASRSPLRNAVVFALLVGAIPAANLRGGAGDGPRPLRITTLEGETREVLAVFSTDASRLTLPEGESIRLDDLQRLEPVGPGPAQIAAVPSAIELRLVGQGRVVASGVTVQDDVCQVDRSDGAVWNVSIDDVQALRFPSPDNDALTRLFREPRGGKDRFAVHLEGSTTIIDGFLERLGPHDVTFEWMGKTRTLPREGLQAIVFSDAGAEAASPARFVLQLWDGSSIDASSLESTSGESARVAAVVSRSTTLEIPWESVRRISVRSNRVRALSDLVPTEVMEQPIVAFPRRWQADLSVMGRPLRGGLETFDHGLGVQAGTTLRFEIGPGWSEFRVLPALDPDAGIDGDCECVVRGDGRELWRGRLRTGEEPQWARIDLKGVARLELAVEYGENLDFGDRVNWCEAMLIRPPEN